MLPILEIFSSIWTLIQAIIYLAICVTGYQIYICSVDIGEGNILIQLIYMIYFYNTECNHKIDLSVNGIRMGISMNISMSKNPESADITNIWMIVYICILSMWILSSFIMMFGVIITNKAGRYKISFDIPWILISFIIMICDVIATIMYGSHIPETNSLRKLFEFIGLNLDINNNDTELKLTWLPSALMVVFFGRALVVWVVNFSLTISVLVKIIRLSRLPAMGTAIHAHTNKAFTYNEPQSMSPYQNNFMADDGRPMSVDRLNSNEPPFSMNSDIYRNNNQGTNWLEKNPETYDRPSNLRREFEQRNNPILSGPEELRGQLPWSYFQDRREAPRTAPRHLSEGERPPVPVPDYTLHFPKRKREGEIDKGSRPPLRSNNSRDRPSQDIPVNNDYRYRNTQPNNNSNYYR